MSFARITNLGGMNLFVNPLAVDNATLLQSVNMDSYPYGAKQKRSGYVTHLGTADGSAVTTLTSWTKNDGSLFLYRASGSSFYHSVDGTAAWTLSGNGTITAGNHVGGTVLDDTLIIGENAGSTRHTTNGTSFTNTTLAPVGEFFTEYQSRVYIGGTSSSLFYSTTGDATNWNTSGTSDSSSISIPGAGKIGAVFKVADRVIASKTSGIMNKWDGQSRIDMATSQAPTSPYSIANSEGYFFYLNRDGVNGYGGDRPKILSNAVQPYIYNNTGSAVAGSVFDDAPGVIYRNDYMVALGTTTDDFVRETVDDAVLKYDFQKNEFSFYRFANFPKSFHAYTDTSGNEKLIFGDSGGQCYQLAGTATTDNGNAIEGILEYVIHLGMPETDKKWNEYYGFFNPGCEASIQIATSNTWDRDSLDWIDLGDARNGFVRYGFPEGSRSKFLFVRIHDNSKSTPFRWNGDVIDYDPVGVRLRK